MNKSQLKIMSVLCLIVSLLNVSHAKSVDSHHVKRIENQFLLNEEPALQTYDCKLLNYFFCI